MPNTSNQGIYYPATTDTPNLPGQMQTQIGTFEKKLVLHFASSADRATRHPSPVDGDFTHLADVDTYEGYVNSAYQIVWRPNNLPSFSPIVGTYNSARPIQWCLGYVEGTAASNSNVAINPTPPGKTVSCVLSAVATAAFKFGEPTGFVNTYVRLDMGAGVQATTAVQFTFSDDASPATGAGAVIVGMSYTIAVQTTT